MGNKNKNKTAQNTESVQNEIIQDAEISGAVTETKKGKTYTKEEFFNLPGAGRIGGSREITTYTQLNKKYPLNVPVRLLEVCNYTATITNTKGDFEALSKAVWVAYNGKVKNSQGVMVANNNKIGYRKARTEAGEILIMFYEK